MLTVTIALEGIEIIAPIGFYKTERENKNTFVIDVSVEEPFDDNKDSDDINNTLNYEKLFTIVEEEMKKECHLIEDVAHRIYRRITKLSNDFRNINITIRKKNPPLNGNVKFSKVELRWNNG